MFGVWKVLAALVAFQVFVVGAQEACNNRGHIRSEDGKCICDRSQPATGESGWAGSNCTTRVFGAELNAADMTATSACRAANCSGMEPLEWVCFYSPLDWGGNWKHLTTQLNRTSADEDGDPDLYGLFTGGPHGQDRAPGLSPWDVREISSSYRPSVVKSIQKADISDGEFTGVYQCVKAYGRHGLTFSMRSTLTKCPSSFTTSGEQLICSSPIHGPPSSQRFDHCTPEGTCACKDPWKKPEGSTYTGLGFEDCSAELEQVGLVEHGKPWQKQLVAEDGKSWRFFSFEVDPDDYQVNIHVDREDEQAVNGCDDLLYFEAYAKWGQPPGWGYGQYDFRAHSSWGDEDSLQDMELAFDRSMNGFQSGKWYLGVNAGDAGQCKVSLTIRTFDCPLGCNGHGTCLKPTRGNRTCQCDEGFLGTDCAYEAKALELGQQAQMNEASFEYDFRRLPDMSGLAAGHNVEVALEVAWSSHNFRDWARGRPELLLLQGDNSTDAHPSNYTMKHTLEEPNTTYTYTLCPSQISEGKWRVAIYNPASSLFPIAYNLTAKQVGYCLHNCSSRGQCQDDGSCICNAGYAGGDCSVTSSGASTGCTPGSRRPTHMSDKQGTCWHDCECHGSDCRYNDNACAVFTCDSASMRQKGSANECVRDECTQDEWEEQNGQACLRKCECPSDGSPCRAASSCQRDKFVCTGGYKRFSDGQPKCYRLGCMEGSLQMDSSKAVANGLAYAACVCDGPEVEGEDKCAFHPQDQRTATITCNSGYTLQGAQQLPGTHASTGGRCVRAGSGASAGAVALWVILSASISGALGCAGLWYWQARHRGSSPVGDSYYQELSPSNTGF
ncbi:hypothetical protein WJX74_004561 [Apatococcus lobatus]|uniref:EGF-like domain-containing protein n=1 Tax=Apatococcus lobatus TaxID=904363 RepID=A0AAW1RHM2_9CHLO